MTLDGTIWCLRIKNLQLTLRQSQGHAPPFATYSKALQINTDDPITLKGSGPLSYSDSQAVHWKVMEESGLWLLRGKG